MTQPAYHVNEPVTVSFSGRDGEALSLSFKTGPVFEPSAAAVNILDSILIPAGLAELKITQPAAPVKKD